MLGVGVVFGSSLSVFSPFCSGMCLSHAYYMYITCAGVGVGSNPRPPPPFLRVVSGCLSPFALESG